MAEAKKKEKKGQYKGGPARKSYLQNMAKQGGGTYSKFGDYDPSEVHTGDINYTSRGQNLTVSESLTTPDIFANELVNRAGKLGGAPFRHKGTLYKIVPSGRSYASEEIKV